MLHWCRDGDVTDAKTLIGALWLQNVLSGVWSLDWKVCAGRAPADNPAMKVLDLQCAHDHGFEGWFASEDDFQDQLAPRPGECPMCGDTAVTKMLTAPRLNLGAGRGERAGPGGGARRDMQAAWMKMVRHVLENTEDVGERFAEEARRMHYGEADERGIRGQASPREARLARRRHRGAAVADPKG